VRGLEDRDEGPRGNFLRRHVTILVPRSYDANAQGLPGPYKSSVAATFNLEQTLKGSGVEPAAGTELWDIRSEGGTIELRLQYQRGVAMRQKQETRPRSAVDLTILRIYRVDRGLDLVRSVPARVDRVQAYSLRVTVPDLRPLFDGSEKLMPSRYTLGTSGRSRYPDVSGHQTTGKHQHRR